MWRTAGDDQPAGAITCRPSAVSQSHAGLFLQFKCLSSNLLAHLARKLMATHSASAFTFGARRRGGMSHRYDEEIWSCTAVFLWALASTAN